jgi:methylated-DNA-[protein]-cysteine S-methyltransferase
VRYREVESPLGPLLLAGTGDVLREVRLPDRGRAARPGEGWDRDDDGFRECRRQLDAYFARRLRAFELELAPEGTPFQREVWATLLRIPYGHTVTYGEIAEMIGRPRAVRAVGLANGANPIPIVIPCHRVIGRDGTLTGYGGGLEAKAFLLDLEGVELRRPGGSRRAPGLF